MMHGRGKSSPVIVARKPANKADPETVSAAESVERRTGAEGNADQPATNRTQGRARVAATGLALALVSIRQAAMLDCQYPRWEPYAGKLHVRVCAGGARQLASLPRLRREFITTLGGAAAWPLAARAQKSAIPVIGYLNLGSPESDAPRLTGLRQGLNQAGYVEGRNFVIEYRWAGNQADRLPALAADLVRLQVTVIVVAGTPAALAAKAATTAIPIVFSVGADSVQLGLVASLNRPGGNLTGFNALAGELGAKQFALLHELAPSTATIGLLENPDNQTSQLATRDVLAAATVIGLKVHIRH